MNTDEIMFYINEVYHGNSIDGRKMRALKNRGYVDNNVVTTHGKIMANIMEHKPFVPLCHIEFTDEVVHVSEYSQCSCGHSETMVFECDLSVAKLVEEYNKYATSCNSYINDKWDYMMDNDHVRWTQYIMDKAKNEYWSENNYTVSIVINIVKSLMNGDQSGDFTTSEKYSFSDTPDEFQYYNADTNGQSVYAATVLFYK